MKYKFGYLLLFLVCGIDISCFSQPVPIGQGWAQNSINTVVFRKNSVVSHEGAQYAAFYDSVGFVVLAGRESGNSHWDVKRSPYLGEITDAHRAISIMTDGDGYLHMAWNHHNNSLHYGKSTMPGMLTVKREMAMTGSDEDDVTYPEFFRLPDGDLIFMYRHGQSGSGNLVINRYSCADKAWERLHDVLIDGEGQRNAYWQACVDKQGTIHISWVWRETWDVSTNHDMCYARSADRGDTWQKSTGERYTIPITVCTAEYAAHIPQKSELINQTSMYADADGTPYIATYFKPAGSEVPQYHLMYKNDDGAWVTMQITDRSTAFSLSGGGTKKIPVSRPQVVVGNDAKVYLMYRDVERGNRVSVNVSLNLNANTWEVYDLTDFSVESWEPSYDTELWKDSLQLQIFVQKSAQGDGESLEALPAQPVFIYEFTPDLKASDILKVIPFVKGDDSDS